jgi:hypothetical protein
MEQVEVTFRLLREMMAEFTVGVRYLRKWADACLYLAPKLTGQFAANLCVGPAG